MIILASVQRLGTVFKSPISCFLHNNVSYTERLRQSATTLKQLTGKVDHIDHLVGSWRSPLDAQHPSTKTDLECDKELKVSGQPRSQSDRASVGCDGTSPIHRGPTLDRTWLWCIKALTQGLCKVADTRACLNPLGGATVDRTCPGLPSLIGIWNIWRPGGHLEVFGQ